MLVFVIYKIHFMIKRKKKTILDFLRMCFWEFQCNKIHQAQTKYLKCCSSLHWLSEIKIFSQNHHNRNLLVNNMYIVKHTNFSYGWRWRRENRRKLLLRNIFYLFLLVAVSVVEALQAIIVFNVVASQKQ